MENKTANGMYVLRGELKKGLVAELVKAYDQLTQESEKLKILGSGITRLDALFMALCMKLQP